MVLRQQLELSVTNLDRWSARLVQGFELTVPQFKVLVALGDGAGLTCKRISEQSLITKGSLLPILDRLESRGLIQRRKGDRDSRQTIVSLTEAGQAVYERLFPAYVAACRIRISNSLSADEQEALVRLLGRLTEAFGQRSQASWPAFHSLSASGDVTWRWQLMPNSENHRHASNLTGQ